MRVDVLTREVGEAATEEGTKEEAKEEEAETEAEAEDEISHSSGVGRRRAMRGGGVRSIELWARASFSEKERERERSK